ncbi:hypothetical protein C7A11_14860 [Pseudomonas simiae]|nr:hypothetical protein C7A11_14860 [Pseudomonas simiae]TKK06286.1 hypothetical protein PflCFBP13514_08895 [Pseudomonas fluorescens]
MADWHAAITGKPAPTFCICILNSILAGLCLPLGAAVFRLTPHLNESRVDANCLPPRFCWTGRAPSGALQRTAGPGLRACAACL